MLQSLHDGDDCILNGEKVFNILILLGYLRHNEISKCFIITFILYPNNTDDDSIII